jgi:hypothetical protein
VADPSVVRVFAKTFRPLRVQAQLERSGGTLSAGVRLSASRQHFVENWVKPITEGVVTFEAVLLFFPDARRAGSEYVARCPAHEERTPSLSIRAGQKGTVLFCHAGCALESILAARRLTVADLWYAPPFKAWASKRRPAAVPQGEDIRKLKAGIR